ncbi:MAG: hypothetical protein IH840_08420 [Candidatus Heimdallarchaeota archaeon]|nr:hypothetical protein [Candidatus Heimdallarchaeota archaeon]
MKHIPAGDIMLTENLATSYEMLKPELERIKAELLLYIKDLLSDIKRYAIISGRVKNTDKFIEKTIRKTYDEPLEEINDLIGIRVVVHYLDDVPLIVNKLKEGFRFIESTKREPSKISAFEYESFHMVCFIPSSLILDDNLKIEFFEIQIPTLMQFAFAEASHDLGYKGKADRLSELDKRKIAFCSAQTWGADQLFNELHRKPID